MEVEHLIKDKHVSIHTPVWGVTVSLRVSVLHSSVSIHTPVWGVTKTRRAWKCDATVSIHTPVWGVTCNDGIVTPSLAFQSTRPCGA